jgi:tetratricopeptide (TPR) repeat protein
MPDAMNTGRDAESVALLKTLVEREPGHANGHYLLAAQYAQLGMMDRAEAGFLAALKAAPDLVMARFQLGQLLLVQGRGEDAKAVFAPLLDAPSGVALGDYARALTAAANDDAAGTVAALEAGLACPQDIPALRDDMQRLLERLGGQQPPPAGGTPATPMFLSGYGRAG